MRTFKSLVTEAAFSNKDLQSVASKMASVLSRRLSKTMYQYGGSNYAMGFKKSKQGKGLGILYFMNDTGEAVRFNWEPRSSRSVQVTSIDHWVKWSPEFKNPDWTMSGVESLNVVQLLDAVEQFLKSPGQPVKFSLMSEETITEGADNLKAIAHAMYSEYGQTEVKVSELKNYARKLGKKLQYYETAKLPRKTRGMVDISAVIQVARGESEEVVDNPADVKVIAAARKVPVDELFQDLADLCDLVISGARPSLLITGSGGTGKTYTVKQRIKAAGMVKGQDYEIKKGATSTFGLYTDFFLARKNKLIVFDDNDDVFKDMTSQNLLKAALDSYEDREISWTSKMTIPVDQSRDRGDIEFLEDSIEQDLRAGEEKVKLQNTFKFTGRVIFISNLPENKIPQPVISRSLTIDVTLSDNEMLQRMNQVIPTIASELGVSEDQANGVLDKLHELANAGEISSPTMRTLPAAINIMKSGLPRWENLLKYAAKN